VATAVVASPLAGAVAQQPEGFRALSGAAATRFQLPPDIELVERRAGRDGGTIERFQQMIGEAEVLGGQLTLHRDSGGRIIAVVGAHYPGLTPSNTVGLSRAAARGIVDRDIGGAGQRDVTLMIHPGTGAFFYRIETRRDTSRWVHWINAQSGALMNRFDSLMEGSGIGVDGDEKDLTGMTVKVGSLYELRSVDVVTNDQGSSRRPFLGSVATDSDNTWDTPGRVSPGQGALVDAHYYAHLAVDYFRARHGFDIVTMLGDPLQVQAHYSSDYVNAFWNGRYVAFGDGDGIEFDPLTALDVVSHEIAHAVTEYTSDLIYQNESGALNESFSDIMAAAAEALAEMQNKETLLGIDGEHTGGEYLIGEDFDLRPLSNGFRNMADPAEDGDPAHYDDRYTGTADNGGVHINSGIPNHAFYLLANGGKGVQGIGLGAAEAIFFDAFTTLPASATMCQARATPLVVPSAGSHVGNVAAAWNAVGLDTVTCAADAPPTIVIVAPADDAQVSGTVAIGANASSDTVSVEFFAGSALIDTDADGSDGWGTDWNSTTVADGPITIQAVAADAAAQTATSSVQVTVANGGAAVDADGDGYSPPADCDDGDPSTYPGAPDRGGRNADGVDNDCDGRPDK
jgi:Zn-dependent metalloprotease